MRKIRRLAVRIVGPVKDPEFEIVLSAIDRQVVGILVYAFYSKCWTAHHHASVPSDVDIRNTLLDGLQDTVAVGSDTQVQSQVPLRETRVRVNAAAVLRRAIDAGSKIVNHRRTHNPGVTDSQVLRTIIGFLLAYNRQRSTVPDRRNDHVTGKEVMLFAEV